MNFSTSCQSLEIFYCSLPAEILIHCCTGALSSSHFFICEECFNSLDWCMSIQSKVYYGLGACMKELRFTYINTDTDTPLRLDTMNGSDFLMVEKKFYLSEIINLQLSKQCWRNSITNSCVDECSLFELVSKMYWNMKTVLHRKHVA